MAGREIRVSSEARGRLAAIELLRAAAECLDGLDYEWVGSYLDKALEYLDERQAELLGDGLGEDELLAGIELRGLPPVESLAEDAEVWALVDPGDGRAEAEAVPVVVAD